MKTAPNKDGSRAWLAAAGVLIAAGVAAAGVVTWRVTSSEDDGASPDNAALARTGNVELDRLIDLLVHQDVDGLMSAIQMTTLGCSEEQTIGSPPPCAPGASEGTPVDAFPISYCEGTYGTDMSQVRAAFGAALSRLPSVAVYAVLRGGGTGATNGYTVAVTEDVPSQPTAPVSFWRADENGRLIGLSNECGAYGAAQQVEYRFPTADYVVGPIINCSPGPGEVANLLVVVDGFSPGSILPQFTGLAKTTLGTTTGERAIVDVRPDTTWIGAITRLEDVRSGMELQATGRRDENCIINAETILTPESVDIVDTRLGFQAKYPYGWIENAVPFPYASCVECVTLGPRDVQYPYGIQVYAQPSDPGCTPSCYFSINVGTADAAHDVTVDGLQGSRREHQRTAPLGFDGANGDTTPYRQIATVIHRGTDALLVVAFFREGDHPAEENTRAAYEQFVGSMRVLDAVPPAP